MLKENTLTCAENPSWNRNLGVGLLVLDGGGATSIGLSRRLWQLVAQSAKYNIKCG